MSELVERVMEVLAERLAYPLGIKRRGLSGLDKESVGYVMIRDTARAAIAAMREPTDAMATAGQDECLTGQESATAIYRAMIDAALADHYDTLDNRE